MTVHPAGSAEAVSLVREFVKAETRHRAERKLNREIKAAVKTAGRSKSRRRAAIAATIRSSYGASEL